MKKLIKKNGAGINTVEKYGCYCSCWCIFEFTKQENVTNIYNGAR